MTVHEFYFHVNLYLIVKLVSQPKERQITVTNKLMGLAELASMDITSICNSVIGQMGQCCKSSCLGLYQVKACGQGYSFNSVIDLVECY